jgi:hypothetical protein
MAVETATAPPAAALTFDAEGHIYSLDGRRVRSVTGLLRKVGLIDFSKIPSQILEAARLRGTKVHQAIHYYNERDLDVLAFCREFPGYAGYLQSWIRLAESGRLQTVLCEHRLACRLPRYAGTLDWLGLLDGHAAILDFATGRPEDAAKHLQTAGYVNAAYQWAREPGEERLRAFLAQHKFIERASVKLDKHGGLPKLTPYRDPKDFTKFRLIAETVGAVDEERPKSQPWQWEEELVA